MRAFAVGMLLVAVGISSSAAAATSNAQAKIDRIFTQAQTNARLFKDAKAAIKKIAHDKSLKKALRLKGEQILLGERSGEGFRPVTVYARSMHLGFDEFDASLSAKVKWTERLLLTGEGVRVYRYESVAQVKDSTIKAFRADLDRQFSKKPDFIVMPKIAVEHDTFGESRFVDRSKIKLGFFQGGEKLSADKWGAVTADQVAAAVEKWSKQ